jgi:DNA-binding Lrp family transcriptional regulator
MSIANPAYDVIFKYLLDDERIARLMLSALLGREVLELSFVPTESRSQVDGNDAGNSSGILVLRMDFAAKVKLEDGSRKLVLIEIQKARDTSDLMRFRRYLGASYADSRNVYMDDHGKVLPLPILTIYFLGEGLKGIDLPVLKVDRRTWDPYSGEDVLVSDPFLECLTHDSIIVQMNRLKDRRRTELEQLLAIFDQGEMSHTDSHLLDILEVNFPARYREILRRLQLACADRELRLQMDLEDDIVRLLREKARESADKDKIIGEMDKAIEEKDKAIEEMDKAIEEKDKAIEEKDKLILEMERRLAEWAHRQKGL